MIDPLKRARLKNNEDEARETAEPKKQRERNQRLTQILKTKDRELAAKEKTIQKSIPTQNDKSPVTGGFGNNKESVGDSNDH